MNRKTNPIAAYFLPFGLRQLTDFLLLGGSIVLIVGLCTTEMVVLVGLGIYAAATMIALFRCIRIIFSGINKRSPEYKSAIVNAIVMAVIMVVVVVGFVLTLLWIE